MARVNIFLLYFVSKTTTIKMSWMFEGPLKVLADVNNVLHRVVSVPTVPHWMESYLRTWMEYTYKQTRDHGATLTSGFPFLYGTRTESVCSISEEKEGGGVEQLPWKCVWSWATGTRPGDDLIRIFLFLWIIIGAVELAVSAMRKYSKNPKVIRSYSPLLVSSILAALVAAGMSWLTDQTLSTMKTKAMQWKDGSNFFRNVLELLRSTGGLVRIFNQSFLVLLTLSVAVVIYELSKLAMPVLLRLWTAVLTSRLFWTICVNVRFLVPEHFRIIADIALLFVCIGLVWSAVFRDTGFVVSRAWDMDPIVGNKDSGFCLLLPIALSIGLYYNGVDFFHWLQISIPLVLSLYSAETRKNSGIFKLCCEDIPRRLFLFARSMTLLISLYSRSWLLGLIAPVIRVAALTMDNLMLGKLSLFSDVAKNMSNYPAFVNCGSVLLIFPITAALCSIILYWKLPSAAFLRTCLFGGASGYIGFLSEVLALAIIRVFALTQEDAVLFACVYSFVVLCLHVWTNLDLHSIAPWMVPPSMDHRKLAFPDYSRLIDDLLKVPVSLILFQIYFLLVKNLARLANCSYKSAGSCAWDVFYSAPISYTFPSAWLLIPLSMFVLLRSEQIPDDMALRDNAVGNGDQIDSYSSYEEEDLTEQFSSGRYVGRRRSIAKKRTYNADHSSSQGTRRRSITKFKSPSKGETSVQRTTEFDFTKDDDELAMHPKPSAPELHFEDHNRHLPNQRAMEAFTSEPHLEGVSGLEGQSLFRQAELQFDHASFSPSDTAGGFGRNQRDPFAVNPDHGSAPDGASLSRQTEPQFHRASFFPSDTAGIFGRSEGDHVSSRPVQSYPSVPEYVHSATFADYAPRHEIRSGAPSQESASSPSSFVPPPRVNSPAHTHSQSSQEGRRRNDDDSSDDELVNTPEINRMLATGKRPPSRDIAEDISSPEKRPRA